jgi:hypothetical protein
MTLTEHDNLILDFHKRQGRWPKEVRLHSTQALLLLTEALGPNKSQLREPEIAQAIQTAGSRWVKDDTVPIGALQLL